MINKQLENAINSQIQKELYSEYLYLAVKVYFLSLNLQGFVNWFDVQIQEEHAHAMGLLNYLVERGGNVELLAIEQPKFEANSPLEAFEKVLAHEQYVTSEIGKLADVAEEVRDRAALSFLDWYVNEQVEEEANVDKVLKTLKLIADDKNALLMFDKDLATRTFVPPVIG